MGRGEVYKGYKNFVYFVAEAYIYAPRNGTYKFTIGSDDGSKLYIDDELIISNKWEYPSAYSEKSTTVNLTKGRHILTLEYYESEGDTKVLFDCDKELLTWEE